MIVTIFADASFCHDTKAAGWGCWIKNDIRSVTYSGVFHVSLASSAEAELCALVNATHKAVVQGHAPAGSFLVLESDCTRALDIIRGRLAHRGSLVEKAARRKLFELLENNRLRFKVKHVRGHQGGRNARSWVNETCDRLARTAMRSARGKMTA